MSMRKLIAAGALLAACSAHRPNRRISESRSRPRISRPGTSASAPTAPGCRPAAAPPSRARRCSPPSARPATAPRAAVSRTTVSPADRDRWPATSRPSRPWAATGPTRRRCSTICAAPCRFTGVEVPQQRRGLCGLRLHPQSQRRHRRRRGPRRAVAAQGENAEPGRVHPVPSRRVGSLRPHPQTLGAAPGSCPAPRPAAQRAAGNDDPDRVSRSARPCAQGPPTTGMTQGMTYCWMATSTPRKMVSTML